MFVDNKFIFLSLPRCASTAFHISCIRHDLDIKHCNHWMDTPITDELKSLSNIDLVYNIKHIHEELVELKAKFGYEYPVISVKRNKYDRFVSYFNHAVGQLYRMDEFEIYNKLKNISTNELMCYTRYTIANKQSIEEYIPIFLKSMGIEKYNTKLNRLLMPIFAPLSYYHANDSNIIWFDFDKIYELEEWVSKICNIDFKMENFGSSKQHSTNVIVDDNFIEKYEMIYSSYENLKKEKSLI